MAKPKTPNQKSLYKALNIRLNKYMVLVQAVFDALNQQAANIAGMTGFSGEGEFEFSDYPQVKEAVDRLRLDYVQSMRSIIYRGTSDEWKQSNLMQDLLADKAMNFYTSQAGKKKHKVYYQTNSDAMKAFQQRRDKGLGLSQKLWDMSGNYKTEMEYAISTAIQRGTSAVQLSKQLSKYLNDFDSLKKDYKEKYGKAVDCHDCEYRSIRLARSEINMAYRSAEQARWRQMDFILGYEIKLSKGHKERNYDICDELAGRYPKDFDWKGWHSNCYLPNAQVLTNHGWKYIKDVLSEDLVLSLNPQTRNVEYVGLTAKQAFEYEGEIVRFYNRSLDCAVTADHRMIFLGKGTKRIRYTQAKVFRKGNGAFYRGCNYDADDRMFIAINGDIFKFDLFCEFMAYWLSDGSLQHDNNITIAQQKGEPAYDSIIRCLSEMGYHIWFTKDSINFNDKNLNQYLRQFGLSNKKFIPKEILNASKRQIKIFLDAYVKCDGYTRQPHSFIGNHGNVFKSATTEKMYFTTSPQLCGDLCELILKAGYRPSIGVKPPTEHVVKKDGTIIKGNYDCYIIRVCNALTATVFDKKIENYKGMVYDLTLEKNHIMYIQQNGRCYWGSNCTCYEIPILKTEEQFFADEDAPETEQTKPIQEFPDGFNNYIEKNLGKIATANSKGTLGYFIRDNEDVKDCALLMNKARSVGDAVQSIAENVAGAHGAVVTPINYKGFGSLYRKVHYGENGKPTPIAQIKDSVRNTIVLDGDLKKVITDLSKDSHWLRTKVQLPADFNGYSGNIVNLTMDNGVVAEIQVNTPKMIFAKESEKHARKILGDELYEKIAKETGMEGGVGHKLYEQIRVLDKVKDAEKIKELQAQSVEYYSHFASERPNVKPYVMSSGDADRLHGLNFNHIDMNKYEDSAIKGFNIPSFDSVMETIGDEHKIYWKDKRIRFMPNLKGSYNAYLIYKSEKGDAELQRIFKIERGKKVVQHELLVLPTELQHKGISKKLFRSLFEEYENMGIDIVRVEANISVGGYAWGRYGFSAKTSEISFIVKMRYEAGAITDVEYAEIKEILSEARENIRMDKLANLKCGERLLHDKNVAWTGFIDLHNKEQMDYLHKFLGM